MLTPNGPLYRICFGSKRLVERYLTAVSQHLKKTETEKPVRLSA